jgi:hypothetical protein
VPRVVGVDPEPATRGYLVQAPTREVRVTDQAGEARQRLEEAQERRRVALIQHLRELRIEPLLALGLELALEVVVVLLPHGALRIVDKRATGRSLRSG